MIFNFPPIIYIPFIRNKMVLDAKLSEASVFQYTSKTYKVMIKTKRAVKPK